VNQYELLLSHLVQDVPHSALFYHNRKHCCTSHSTTTRDFFVRIIWCRLQDHVYNSFAYL